MGRVRKRILAALLAVGLAAAPAASVSADEEETGVNPADQREIERQTAYAIPPDTNSLAGWPQGPSVYGDSAIVMDMDSGAIVYGKQIDKRHYPASLWHWKIRSLRMKCCFRRTACLFWNTETHISA